MTTAEATNPIMSPQEYLAREREATEKHEYFHGEVVAMAGGTLEHNAIVMNLGRELTLALRGRGCGVYASDLKVWAPKLNAYVYPDVTVTCSQPSLDEKRRDILLNPQVVFEVLSPSTEGNDRGRKFEAYRSIPSLMEYVLIHQDRAFVEQYLRQPDDSWLIKFWPAGSRLGSPALDCVLALDEIYLNVTFPPPEDQ